MINPAILLRMMKGSTTGRGKVVVGTEPEKKEKDTVDMKAAIFFDGTSNNRTNIETRMKSGMPWWVKIEPIGLSKASYQKSFSNIAVLERINDFKDEDREVSIYIEGAGTGDNVGDEYQLGAGLGTGSQGVEEKVTRGIIDLRHALLKASKRTGKRLGHVQVDVFGFSRGAASARYFVARRTEEFFPGRINLCKMLGLPPSAVTINFVGLFDTVSSYGPEIITSFQNDVKQLHLNIGGGAKKVVQLGAGDEYRLTFARTNIDSSIKAGIGFECIIPGAHADVGGGNAAEAEEASDVLLSERDELIKQRWFLDNQLPLPLPPPVQWRFKNSAYGVPELQPLPPTQVFNPWIVGTRKLTNHYQYIPLSLMMALAKKHGAGVTFKTIAGCSIYDVPADLRELQKLMHKHVVDAQDTTHFELPASFHWVRHRYLHISASRKGLMAMAMGPHMTNGRPQRQVISDAT